MAEERGKLACCIREDETTNVDFIATDGVGASTIGDVKLQDKGNYFKSNDTIDEAIEKVKDAKKGKERAEDLCIIYNTLAYLVNKTRKWHGTDISSWVTKLKDYCGKNTVKAKTCKQKIGDKKYNELKDKCNERKKNGEAVKWSDSHCGCVADEKSVVAPVEEVKGCMDDKANNYDSTATVSRGCEFEKDIVLENEFCFCITDTCEEIGNCLKGTQTIEAKRNSWESFDKLYKAIYERALTVISTIKPQTRISTEKGFYGETFDSDYAIDLAKALTILEFRGYSLNRAARGMKNTESDLVMKNEDGDYLGFFSGASMTSPLFNKFGLQLTPSVIQMRVANNPGGYIQPEHINGIKRYLNPKYTNRYNLVKNVNIDIDGRIMLPESRTKSGLGALLEPKITGLEKILK